MKRTGICGLAGLMLVLCLGTPVWAYTLELVYDANSNAANPAATEYYSNYPNPTTYAPGPVSGPGEVPLSATTGESPPYATGATTVRPAVVLTDHVDSNQSIINAGATAFWYGYGQGFGSSNIGFIIHAAPGEDLQVTATIGFRVSGTVNFGTVADQYYVDYNYLILNYASYLIDLDNNEHLIVQELNRTWLYAPGFSENYGYGGAINVSLSTDELYTFKGRLGVDAMGTANDPLNSINFDAFVSIGNIQGVPIPLPPGIVLLGSGLIGLGISALRRRSKSCR
jgi:hypothetical protein